MFPVFSAGGESLECFGKNIVTIECLAGYGCARTVRAQFG